MSPLLRIPTALMLPMNMTIPIRCNRVQSIKNYNDGALLDSQTFSYDANSNIFAKKLFRFPSGQHHTDYIHSLN